MTLANEEIKTTKKTRRLYCINNRIKPLVDYFSPKIKQDPLRFDGETILSIYRLAGLE